MVDLAAVCDITPPPPAVVDALLALGYVVVGTGRWTGADDWAFRRGSDFLDDLEEAELLAERIHD